MEWLKWVLDNVANSDRVFAIGSIALVVTCILAPRKFFGIEVEWNAPKVLAGLVLSLIFFGISLGLPVYQAFLRAHTVTTADVDDLASSVSDGRQAAWAASTNTSDNAGCVRRATASYQELDRMQQKISILRLKTASH